MIGVSSRGADALRYPWGDEFDGTWLNYCDGSCELGHSDDTFDDGFTELAPVGSYPDGISWCGALDMAGNVWEWGEDVFQDYVAEAQENPVVEDTDGRRILRGGSRHASPDHNRSALRSHSAPQQIYDHLGFRCALKSP